jgi:phosphoribosylamine--glycine ligase
VKFLVVGTGGREHALAWRLHTSGHEVFAAGGNPGIAQVAQIVDAVVGDNDLVARAAVHHEVDCVVVGPEAPLAAGLVDRLALDGIAAFGPTAAGARLEASKAYAKEVMARGGVPTARSVIAEDLAGGLAAVRAAGERSVVKADGLAAGKGVVVAESPVEAEAAVRDCFSGRFGAAGAKVVVEEFLDGEELSLLVVCDGARAMALPPSQDHKRIGEGDTGPNTGGMGAYSPVPVGTTALVDGVMDTVVEPTLWSLRQDDVHFTGILYVGLMLTADGPKVLEYNVRFGDPEAQAVIPRLDGDFGELLASAAAGALDESAVTVSDDAAMTVVAAAAGYPGTPRTGDPIGGLDAAAAVDGAYVFQAGTAATDGGVVTAGGRVLAVTGRGPTLAAARDTAYTSLAHIDWNGMQFRSDIGWRALPS